MNQRNFYYTTFRVLVFTVLTSFLFSCSKEKIQNEENLTLVFYNVENLFDTIDEPGKDDVEFTPGSEKEWTQERYNKKLEDISKVLSSINENEIPEIIGLCEVENLKVITDLTNTGKLSNGKYKIIHYESPDVRGIDCAMIYKPGVFEVIEHFPIRINIESEADYKTRDILYVKGNTDDKEEFHIFINHWPSRVGGLQQTEPKRMEVAAQLKFNIDSILKENSNANIIIMGDLNDEPDNRSINEILGAKNPDGQENSELVNLMFPDDKLNKGSYFYQGNWNMLDNIIVTSGLLDDNGFQCVDKKGSVFRQEWMEYTNNDSVSTPNRTYGGPNYYGGISDHFPVYFTLQK